MISSQIQEREKSTAVNNNSETLKAYLGFSSVSNLNEKKTDESTSKAIMMPGEKEWGSNKLPIIRKKNEGSMVRVRMKEKTSFSRKISNPSSR